MRRLLFSSLALVVSTVLVLGTAVGYVRGGTCEDGWLPHNDQCYLVRKEYETWDNAESTCQLFGSEMAYGQDKDELSYLKSIVNKRDSYGFWYGAMVTQEDEILIYEKESKYYHTPREGVHIPLPKETALSAPTTKCIGMIRDPNIWEVEFIMQDVPCKIRLPYTCRGDPNNPKIKKDDPNILHNDTFDLFWFSSVADRRSYDDAVKGCAERSMTLMSFRDIQIPFIVENLDKRQDSHVDPWWVGLQVDNGKFSWTSGVKVDPSSKIWSRSNGQYERYKESCRILLTDGTIDERSCRTPKAPFICRRAHRLNGQFGCPHDWSRAGQSCYTIASKRGYEDNRYTDAERICKKRGGHPISVDTPLEKTWLLHSTIMGLGSRQVWTSLNDKKKAGHFLWADGSSPKSDVVVMSPGERLDGGGNCFSLFVSSKTLRKSYCDYEYILPGCQYPANRPEDCVTKNWKYFKGHCYFAADGEDYDSTAVNVRMLHKCYADVIPHNNEIVLSPLKVDTPEILDFVANSLNTTDYSEIWIGLEQTSKGVYVWSDGTLADLSMFKTTYDYGGTDNSTSKCAYMAGDGSFRAVSCSTCPCAHIVCEIEVNYASAQTGGNAGSSYFLTPVLTMAVVVSTFARLLSIHNI